MNKLIFVIIALASTLTFSQTRASTSPHSFGAGLFIGNPTSFNLKYFASSQKAYQFGLAFDFDDYMLVYGDYLLHYPGSFRTTEPFINSLVPYFGIGGIMVITTDDRKDESDLKGKNSGSLGLGLRIPIGVEWHNSNPSIGVYLEIAPGISIIPETSGLFMGGIGARFYF